MHTNPPQPPYAIITGNHNEINLSPEILDQILTEQRQTKKILQTILKKLNS